MKKRACAVMVAFGAILCFGAGSSENDLPTSPLTIYSGGFGVGAAAAVSDELKEEVSSTFLKMSFVNSVYFRDNISLFLDINWFAKGANFGADAGFDYLFSNSDFRPFMGFGVGAYHFDHEGAKFGENFGPSATAHAGFILDVTEQLQVRLRVPYHVVVNENLDQTIGFDVSFLFSDKFRKVKKLHYN